MKIGDLVDVVQELGCGRPYQKRYRGAGIVLDIEESTPYHLRDTIINLGKTVTVQLMTGEIEDFAEQSVEVISEL